MRTPITVNYLEFESTCAGISAARWNRLMEGATHANHAQIDKLVKLHLPDLYDDLMLNLYNPYTYYRYNKINCIFNIELTH